MGRLALRAGWNRDDLEFVAVNEIAGDAATGAHLLEFDSVHSRWPVAVDAGGDSLLIEGREVAWSGAPSPAEVDWSGIDIVLDCTGQHRTIDSLSPYLDQGVKKVLVAAPVKEDGALNVVVGVND
ncbi:MAG: type I glyceraldehyde-3-phosphate dehydrogenase, partial [Actinobacteria bacterium]|nr:type I glyceraldehyde-3-phosphate dehydrogenase [Actinomycetota bacterium]